MSDWSGCECGHLGVDHEADGPCTRRRCDCPAFYRHDVVCAHRENNGNGVLECVAPPAHDGAHYLIRLVQRPEDDAEGAA